MNSSHRIILAFSFVTLSLFFISPANAARRRQPTPPPSSGSSQMQETSRMGEFTQATMAARQKVLEAQNHVADCEKKVAQLRNQLNAINSTIPQLQARMTEWNIAAIPVAAVTSNDTETVVIAPRPPRPPPQPEQPGDFLSNFLILFKKNWLYMVGGLVVILWLVNRAMK